MTTPLTPPTFGDKFSVSPTDIGAGYASGITSAGQSIAGAIGAVMGGINARTGEVEPGVLDQKKSSEDLLDMMHMHGMMTDDEYAKAKTSGLGAQQKFIGMASAEFNTKLQAQLEQQRALAVQQASNVGAMARTQAGETGAGARQAAEIQAQKELEAAKLKATAALRPRLVLPPGPTQTAPAPIPNQLNLKTGY